MRIKSIKAFRLLTFHNSPPQSVTGVWTWVKKKKLAVLSPGLFGYVLLCLGHWMRGRNSCCLWFWQLVFDVSLRDATPNLPSSPNPLSSRSVLHDGRKHIVRLPSRRIRHPRSTQANDWQAGLFRVFRAVSSHPKSSRWTKHRLAQPGSNDDLFWQMEKCMCFHGNQEPRAGSI